LFYVKNYKNDAHKTFFLRIIPQRTKKFRFVQTCAIVLACASPLVFLFNIIWRFIMTRSLLLAALMALSLTACGKKDETAAPEAAAPAAESTTTTTTGPAADASAPAAASAAAAPAPVAPVAPAAPTAPAAPAAN
jgi:predicted small lipoprotein YifL